MAEKTSPPIESLSYEDALAELENIVQVLEAGRQPLEEAIALFERGQALSRRCTTLLDAAELKVRTLSGEPLDLTEEAGA